MTSSKRPRAMPKTIKGIPVHKIVFRQLVDEGIVVQFVDLGANKKHYALTPRYRRELYRLGIPTGSFMENKRREKPK